MVGGLSVLRVAVSESSDELLNDGSLQRVWGLEPGSTGTADARADVIPLPVATPATQAAPGRLDDTGDDGASLLLLLFQRPVVAPTGEVDTTEVTVQELVHERNLLGALARTAQILREVFGEDAYVDPRIMRHPTTGLPRLVFEAHYCFQGGSDRFGELVELHEEFLLRLRLGLSGEVRKRFSLLWSAVDADQTE
jgi:hypothetical protein